MGRGDDPTQSSALRHAAVPLHGASDAAPAARYLAGAHSSRVIAWRGASSDRAASTHVRLTPRAPFLYGALRRGCLALLERLFDWRIAGTEHLPTSGPFILAANHHNYLDGVVLAAAVPRPIAFLVMPRVYHATPLHPAFHRWARSVPINLERPDPGAIKRVLRSVDGGGIVGIFPEGPFSTEGRLGHGQPGVAMIALRSGVPVVPAAIHGTYQALLRRRFYLPRRWPISVRFGAPMQFVPPRHRRATRADREDVTRGIMKEIAALLGSERETHGPRCGRADVS